MDKMKYELLGNLVKNLDNKRIPLNSAERNTKSKKGTYPYIGANNIVTYINEFIFNEKILCVAEDGGSWGTEQVCANIYVGKTWVNNHAHVLIENGKSNLEYLRFYLNHANLNKHITGTTRGKLTRKELDNIRIPFPTHEDQIRVATILSKAEALIKQRKESIALLDEFLKSTFLEMFGDFGKSTTSKKELLGNNISFLTSGSRGWAKYYSTSGVKFLRIQNIGGGTIRTDNLIYVNPPKSAESKRTIVEEGDLIISITADLGRASVVPKNFGEAYISQHLALIRLNKNVNPIYAAYFYNMPYGNTSIQKKNRSAVKAGLNFNDVKSFPIIIPDLKKQNEFAQIVEKTEALKKQYQASLEELEQLFGSLSQRVFKGELDLSQVKVEKDKHLIKGINWSLSPISLPLNK